MRRRSSPPLASSLGAVFDRRCLALCLFWSESIGLGRRRRLITGRRRGQALPSRLAVEGPGFPLIAKRRKDVTEKALGAQLRWSHRPPALIRTLRAARAGAGSGGHFAAVEFGAGQRPSFGVHGFGRGPAGQLFLRGLDFALLGVGILGPSRVGSDGGLALRRRQIAGRRHHERRALAIIDAFSVPAEAQILEELPHELGVERHVLVLAGALRESAGPARHRRQRHGQRDCCRGSGAPLPVRISVPHGYPLQLTAELCAVYPTVTLGRDQGAFAASAPTRVSYRSPITPATMATSARLKTYHLKLKLAVVR